ncbi:MAG: hypothetical protein ABIR96_01925 [Bdellovibrionota bacterium]
MFVISKKVLATVSLVALASCSSHQGAGVGPQAYRQALNQAFDDLKARSPEGREVASEQSIAVEAGADFSKLRGSIEVVVFPKMSNMAEKRPGVVRTQFGRPTTYSFNVVRNLECAKLVRENTDKWAHRENFKTAAAGQSCAILRIFQSEPKRLVANVRQGDIKETHLYLDSDYAVYGYDYEIMRSNRESEVVHVGTDEAVASGSSGLGMIPLDLPPSNSALSVVADNQPLHVSSDAFVNRKLQELRVSPSCSRAKKILYKDTFGQRNEVQWCQGDVWPTVVENARFVAVLKRGN